VGRSRLTSAIERALGLEPDPELGLRNRVALTLEWARHRTLRSRRTFELDGRTYRYHWGRYHTTWRTERAVELPVVWDAVRAHPPSRVLEVGNVLAHYYPVRHAVVDKYERADGVINRDVVDLRPERDYDLIVSISTLEHVGFDEPQGDRDPEKILRAVDALSACLSPRGRMLVTLPFGYNPHLDRLLDQGGLPLTRCSCMRRVSSDNRWAQAAWDEVRGADYDRPYRCANALVIGVIDQASRGRRPARCS
jgi:hypothetical protein